MKRLGASFKGGLIGRGRVLDLSRPAVMGILNITPDSFSDGGSLFQSSRPDLGAVVERAQSMIDAGAVLLDVGGESSRPGAARVPLEEELRRVMPVLDALSGFDIMLSVDTYKPEVAAQALAGGAHMVNDIAGGRDPRMLEAVASGAGAYCLMHMQGEPATMQKQPRYNDVVTEVTAFLAAQLETAFKVGIGRGSVLADPGFGFGKSLDHNLTLLARLQELTVLDAPLLVGLSRKRMLGSLSGREPAERVSAGVAAATAAMLSGAAVVRTHDVAETVDAVKVVSSLLDRAATDERCAVG